MAVNYRDFVKADRMDAVLAALDRAASPARLVIGTSAFTPGTSTGILVAIIFNQPCGAVTDWTLNFTGLPKLGTAIGTGTAANAELRDGDGAIIVSGLTVGVAGSGANIIINSTAISSGQTVEVTAASIVHA